MIMRPIYNPNVINDDETTAALVKLALSGNQAAGLELMRDNGMSGMFYDLRFPVDEKLAFNELVYKPLREILCVYLKAEVEEQEEIDMYEEFDW